MDVNAEWIVTTDDAGSRLDKFLAASDRLGSRGKAVTALERGKILVNGADAAPADGARRLVAGDVVRFWADRPGSAKRRLEPLAIRIVDGGRGAGGRLAAGRAPVETTLHIVHEDDGIIVVNKPAGLLTVPLEPKQDPSVLEMLEAHLRSHGKHRQSLAVHRIDRDTSGLVLFAKQARAQDVLKEQFLQHEPERIYAAIVYGLVQPASGTWQDFLVWDQRTLSQKPARPEDPRAREAISEYRVVEAFPGPVPVAGRATGASVVGASSAGGAIVAAASLLDVKLHTGKRNQIRIQAALRAHRLIGEKLYARGIDPRGEIPFPRQALHARRLSFQHPLTDRPMTFEAEMPDDMQALLDRLRRG